MLEVPQIQIGRPNEAIQSTPIRPEQCALCFHQAIETNGVHTEEVGDQNNPISRRHADYVKEARRNFATTVELLIF